MEENTFTSNLLETQKYDEIINIINDLYLDLFKTMLDYKNEKYTNGENNFEYLDALVRISYPQFSQNLIHLSVLRNEPGHTYLDIIDTFLSTYMHLKNMYKDVAFENKYLECNRNNGTDIIE